MKLLAIEGSGGVASVALLNLEDDTITAEYTLNHALTHSQTLLPMIDEITARTECAKSEIKAIAVSSGPGSFTGLRIGSATAKGLALALDIPILHVPTIEALAYNLYGFDGYVCPIMDARRDQTYTGMFHFTEGSLACDIEDGAMDINELLDKIEGTLGDKKVIFTGDGIPVFREAINARLGDKAMYAPAGFNRQRASSVAIYGAKLLASGITESSDEHLPDYFRTSQAEREKAEREKAERDKMREPGDGLVCTY